MRACIMFSGPPDPSIARLERAAFDEIDRGEDRVLVSARLVALSCGLIAGLDDVDRHRPVREVVKSLKRLLAELEEIA
jgi:hypothetical protein